MRNRRLVVILALAVGSGLLAGYLALDLLSRGASVAEASPVRTSFLAVAARDLPLGAVLREQDVRLLEWTGDALPAGYASSAAELVGRGLITPVRANEPLLSDKLASREEGGGLSILIPPGMRAVSVRVDEVVAVAGFVLPGARVDVLVTLDPRQGESGTVTRVILQNIQTLAAGQTVQRDLEGKPQTVTVITLLVTPDQAERLTLAANEGRIQLALRNMMDVDEVNTTGMRTAALLGGSRSAPGTTRAVQVQPTTPRQRQESTVVETYRGGVRTLNTF
jgi:pilus assembly protein CpaB